MTTDVDAALAELGLTRADLPAAVAATVAAHLEDNAPDMDALLRAERDGDATGFTARLFGSPDRGAIDLATPDPDDDDRQVVAHIFGRPDPDGDNAA